MPKILTVQDVVAEYRISRTKLYSLIKTGEIEARKLGYRTIITEAEMDRYVASLPVHCRAPERHAA